MSGREHVVGAVALTVVAVSTWYLLKAEGLGGLVSLAEELLLLWCTLKAAGWVADRTFRSTRRREQLQTRADVIGREHELAVAVIEHGSRYVVTAQHWRFGAGVPEDAFAAGASGLDFERARVYLEGIDDGHSLAEWRANHPHNRGGNRE